MLENTIKYVSEVEEEDFRILFTRVYGRISMKAETHPDTACPMREVGELFDALFGQMQGRKEETPAGGTAGESKA